MSRKSKSKPNRSADAAAKSRSREVSDEGGGDATEPRSPEALRAEQIRGSAQRETVEAFVVAFILALLFRAFIAEAFVIPTGSMAPTLMGAHKDLACSRCEQPFRVGASLERRGPVTEAAVVGGICPNCRYTNVLDLADEPNHETFSGDRILVSKFAYTLSDPERWDVIVFKFPGNPKQNYIKRLVGLPEETLTIRHGDVYVRPTGDDQARSRILRKPPEKLLAMRHLVYDTDYQAPSLVATNYPARWQPWRPGAEAPPSDSWQVERSVEGLRAVLPETDPSVDHWLRYFHRWPGPQEWARAEAGDSLADANPYASRLITDFYAYDSAISVDADDIYRVKPSQFAGSRLSRLLGSGYGGGVFAPTYRPGGDLSQFRRLSIGSNNTGRDGVHWVGDLMVEADVETSPESRQLTLELVEAGIRYTCRFDLRDGSAVLGIAGDEAWPFEDGSLAPVATTDVRAGTRHRIRLSNCDDQILLWVDGSIVSFDSPTTYDARTFPGADRPRLSAAHPLDAAPVGLAVQGGPATVHQLRVDRDKYYIATRDSQNGVYDYDMSQLWELTGRNVSLLDLQVIMSDPDLWSEFRGWDARRSVTYVLEEEQYFPMGDNSPESLDARCWAGTKVGGFHRSVDEDAYRWAHASYVPRDLLVGKALAIFWPHPWNSPLPFTPHFSRMQLIR